MREVKLPISSNQLTVLSMGVAAILWTQAASAAADDMPSTTLQTITVTANSSVRDKVQEDGVYVEDYTPAAQASHLSDFLDVIPGVEVGGTSSVNQRVRVRGLDDTNLKVTIDGARQEGAMFYHMGDITIDPDLLKQAEVAVGNNSVTLGNDAIGGAVAFETVDAVDLLKPGQKVGAKLHAGYGSNNDELLTSATVYGAPTDNVDLLAYYGKRDADSGEDGSGRELFEDSESENILLKAGVSILDDHRVGASFSRTEKKGIFPFRPDFPSLSDERIPQKVSRDTYTVDYNFNPVNPLVDVDANIYQTETEILRDNDTEVTPGYDWNAKIKTTGAKVENTSVIESASGRHKLIAGAEHYQKESEMARDGARTGNDEAKNTSVYLEDQWQMGKLTLTPGVRYDRYESPEFVSDGKTYDNVVGALAASYEIAPRTQVFASYTELFNGPDLGQAIFNSNGDGIYVNDDLKPEEGYNSEVGVATTLRGLTLADDALQLSAKYFKSNIENYQLFMRTGNRPGRFGLDCETGAIGGECQGMYNSAEDYEIKGVELAANYSTRDFGMGLSYARARSEGSETGDSIPSVSGSGADSGDRYMLNLNYEPSDEVGLGWRSTYVASLTDNNQDTKPSYDVHDVYVNYSPRQFDGLKATVGVYNLFDETYASHASRLNPADATATDFEMGRNIKTSLTYQF
ncbi:MULTISPECIES: TonB-dependent receptor domain-containing protein [Psychrobacter]|uniref:TonB-dependent receptor n=1 Tax=Psychrobacter halodurans TaxID=2818439 RepID=A0AAW4ILF5_9GAMM|nr:MULTISPECIES: TonB-dependent receptor [Psychrobacter]MBO1516307.1 TonB-dependent receptor [Psychrobacter halodurans]OLF42099.1 TonB-dependent receptor [Psychrobacter sp. Rd 27.2]